MHTLDVGEHDASVEVVAMLDPGVLDDVVRDRVQSSPRKSRPQRGHVRV